MQNNSEQEHFDHIADKYQKAADTWAIMYQQIEATVNPYIANKKVLDVGNGGRFSYDVNLPEKIIAMDVSPVMLDRIKEPAIIKIVGDARDMNNIENESVDVIIFQLVLHHITGSNYKSTLLTLKNIISSSKLKLKPGGFLIIAEPLMHPILFSVERLFFPLTKFILKRFNVSMIFFFSSKIMQKQLVNVFNIQKSSIERTKIKLSGWIDALGGSFPGLIKIPAFMHYVQHEIFIVKKLGEQ